jgi:hypothetical protein
MNLTEGNLLEPLSWDSAGECENFVKNHRCWCGASLITTYFLHKFYAECPEHNKMFEHSVIHRSQAAKIVNDERSGMYELNKDKPPEHTEEENLRALGF